MKAAILKVLNVKLTVQTTVKEHALIKKTLKEYM